MRLPTIKRARANVTPTFLGDLDLEAIELDANGRTKGKFCPRLSRKEIARMAHDVYRGRVFLPMNDRELRDAFGFILTMSASAGHLDFEDREKVWVVGDMSKTLGSRGINGVPMFAACQLIHTRDAVRVVKKVQRLAKKAPEP